MFQRQNNSLLAVIALMLLALPRTLAGCPFCSAIGNTISEDLTNAKIAVVGEWVDDRDGASVRESGGRPDDDEQAPLRSFQISRVLKGEAELGSAKRIQTIFRGQHVAKQVYLLFGFSDERSVVWATALPIQRTSLTYLDPLPKLPKLGPERLSYFLPYLNHPEKTLADDAYNEFARAPYADVTASRSHLDRRFLLQRIADPEVDARRRRLYLTLLGVCGEPADAAAVLRVMDTLEKQKVMDALEEQEPTGLDAAIACYLTLAKADGMQQVEDRYFKNPNVNQKHVFDAVAALRFHGEEAQLIPRQRLGVAMQHLLKNPSQAEKVLPDLARWEDWSAMEQVADLFRVAKGANRNVRLPAARYLMACPKPEAAKLLADLEKLDPDSVRGAKYVRPQVPPDVGDADDDD